jgi:hypothetical protein
MPDATASGTAGDCDDGLMMLQLEVAMSVAWCDSEPTVDWGPLLMEGTMERVVRLRGRGTAISAFGREEGAAAGRGLTLRTGDADLEAVGGGDGDALLSTTLSVGVGIAF